MRKSLVAVIGRPNVGKSTFFNKICGRRIAIVKDIPGVTRDRIYADAEWCGRFFTLVDTGGIDHGAEATGSEMLPQIRRQAEIAAELADAIVFMVDGKSGLIPADREIAEYLRRLSKPVILAVNKLDNFELDLTYDFYELGLGEPVPISCEQSKGLGDLLDVIVEGLPAENAEETDENGQKPLRIAVVGKPNVGKSSLINKILGFERVIVSDIAGTTRDAIDTPMSLNGKDYVLIDTAGLKRKKPEFDTVDNYSVLRTATAIRRADACVILMDAGEIAEQDVRVAGMVHEEGKPSVVAVNKWDLVEKDTFTADKFKDKLKQDLSFMGYFESVFISAVTGQRVDKLFPLIHKVFDNSSRRVTTGTLNDVVRDAVAITPPPAPSGRRLKILYATQPETNPPKFVFFVNDPTLLHFSYERYLENALRKAFDFSGTPIKLEFVARGD